jgi:hypothetical protein
LAVVRKVLVRSALVGAALIAAGTAGGSVAATKATTVPGPVLLGFQDDSTFRWGPAREDMLDRTAKAGTAIIRTNVYWWQVAPKRPANARNPFDPSYHFDDLDQLIRDSQQRGITVLLTIWGTPAWANKGLGKNRLPTKLADLTNFAYALASRYSGRTPGYPYVGYYSVWNEPNLNQFLAPQFNAAGKAVAPANYARLYKAGYAGIKAGNSGAKVGIGETSPRGHDRPTTDGTQPSESPGGFAQKLSLVKGLKFDAWAHHPYPTQPGLPPTQQSRWPNVTLAQLPQFETSLDKWFKRKNIPIWVTEYAYQTKPPGTLGVTVAKQAAYLTQALVKLEKDPRVQMIIWFTFRDTVTNPWKSGLLTTAGAAKPALAAFTKNAATVTTRNNTLPVSSLLTVQQIRLPALQLAYFSGTGAGLGLTYRVLEGTLERTVNQALVPIGRDGWVTLPVQFQPELNHRYTLDVSGTDPHGHPLILKRTLVATH